MESDEFNIFIRSDNRAVCPSCSGLLLNAAGHMRCNDCGDMFVYIGRTDYSENVMRYHRAGRCVGGRK